MSRIAYPLAIVAVLVLSWSVTKLYERKCHCTAKRFTDHGALEFHLAFFGFSFAVLYFFSSDRDDGWAFGLISAALLGALVKRFLQNWIR